MENKYFCTIEDYNTADFNYVVNVFERKSNNEIVRKNFYYVRTIQEAGRAALELEAFYNRYGKNNEK